MHASAIQSALELLIRRQTGNIHDRIGPVRAIHAISAGAWHFTSHLAAVVVPIETEPRPSFPGLVLQMSGGVENLIVVDAEHFASGRQRARWRGANSADLRFKEARRHVREHDERRESVEIRHGAADRKAGDLRARPLDRKSDRSVAQHAEVVRLVRVFPDVLAIQYKVFSEGLLETG